MTKLSVEIWSDIACPWCHVGKRRFEAALARFGRRDEVVVTWRSFELDPDAPRVKEPAPYAERLARKYGSSVAQAEGMIRTMTAAAAAEGLDFRFDRIRPGNTFDAHRLVHLAAEHGRADEAEERLFRAYLTEGAAIGDPEVLSRLAAELELPADEVTRLLAGDAYADEVRADEREARARGIRGVPFFLVDGRHGLSGAQPPEVLLDALERVAADVTAGEACGPDGCS